jgi:Domain of unknown function (DUF4347)
MTTVFPLKHSSTPRPSTLLAIAYPTMREKKTLVVIDSRVTDPQILAHISIEDNTALWLDPQQDGVVQITNTLRHAKDITDLHIIAYGKPGCLYLGNTELSLRTLERYALHLLNWFPAPYPELEQSMKSATTDSKLSNFNLPTPYTLLFYGCNVAAGDAGSKLMRHLQKLTGATIKGKFAVCKETTRFAIAPIHFSHPFRYSERVS